MKIRKILCFLFIMFGVFFNSSNIVGAKESKIINVYFFHTVGCSHCAKMDEYLLQLKEEYNINIIKYNVADNDSKNLLVEVGNVYNMSNVSTPVVAVGGKCYAGINDSIKSFLRNTIERYDNYEYVDVVQKIINNETINDSDIDRSTDEVFKLPLVGDVNVKDFSLFLISIVLGIVDGFNPCAMWVLIFLISMLISNKSRKKIWIFGGAFLFTSALFYFLVMIAWVKTVEIISAKVWFQIIIGIFALIAGGFNLYSYIKSVKNKEVGCEVTNEKERKKIIYKIKKIVAEKNFFIALIGIIALAIIVNFIELACSAGLPVLFSQILAINNIEGFRAILYILLYILFFLIDDLIVFSIAIVTLRVSGVSNKFTKYSHLIGGILMLLIGVLMIFFPNIIMFNF